MLREEQKEAFKDLYNNKVKILFLYTPVLFYLYLCDQI